MTEPYYADDSVTLHHGDCLDVLRELPDESVDAVPDGESALYPCPTVVAMQNLDRT